MGDSDRTSGRSGYRNIHGTAAPRSGALDQSHAAAASSSTDQPSIFDGYCRDKPGIAGDYSRDKPGNARKRRGKSPRWGNAFPSISKGFYHFRRDVFDRRNRPNGGHDRTWRKGKDGN